MPECRDPVGLLKEYRKQKHKSRTVTDREIRLYGFF